MKKRTSIKEKIQSAVDGDAPGVNVPRGISFYEFMHEHAQVRVGSKFVKYSTAGREPLRICIGLIDHVLGNDISYLTQSERSTIGAFKQESGVRSQESESGNRQLADACIDICGGAQFGKTIIGLHLKAYLAAIKGMNTYYALPDDDLVQGIVDGKERPEVIDRIPWLAMLANVGKSLNESGRAVNRKGAMLYSDGKISAISYMRGINAKIPTTFSADCVIVDERDDVKDANEKFLTGRMTASQLRLKVSIGTQRYHAAGQNKLFEEGTQHVGYLTCPGCGERHNPEEAWPNICRKNEGRNVNDPWLTREGDFVDDGGQHYRFDPAGVYYFACPDCGSELDRTDIQYEARMPERIAERKWSVRVSQLCCSGLPVIMFANHWQSAVRDPDAMKAFCCDRLAMPKSSAQKVTRDIIERATHVERVMLSLAAEAEPESWVTYAGLDTGDRCWLTVRRRNLITGRVKTVWAESIAAEQVRAKVPVIFRTVGAACLFVDAAPLRDLTRDLCRIINGIPEEIPSAMRLDLKGRIRINSNLHWNGDKEIWTGLKCAAVEFTGKPGSGIRQQCRLTPANNSVYPVIACNRDEAIGAVIDELLTADDGYQQLDAAGHLRTVPVWLLPEDLPGSQAVVRTLHDHILSGSRKVKSTDGKEESFIDKVENHLLLATTYSRMAETVADVCGRQSCGSVQPKAFDSSRSSRVILNRRDRKVMA